MEQGQKEQFKINKETIKEEVDEKSEKFFKGFDIAIWITPIPILGYGITFTYELGISDFYQYPTSFISLDPTIVAKNSIILVFLLLFVVIFPEVYVLFSNCIEKLINKYQKQKKGKLDQQAMEGILRIGALLIIFSLSYNSTIGEVIKFYFNNNLPSILLDEKYITLLRLAFVSLQMMCFFATIIILLWAYHSFAKKKYIVGGSILIIFILIIPYIFGLSGVIGKSSHYVIEGDKETYVLLNFVKDKLLIAPLDLSDRTIIPEYSLIEAKTDFEPKGEKEGKQLTFNLVKTGPLKVGEAQSLFEN